MTGGSIIVSGFLTTEGTDVYANLVVANLGRRIDQPDMAEEWFVAGWTTDGGSDRASAHLRADGSTDGGTFFAGENGIVQLRLPGVSPANPIRLWAYSGADREPFAFAPDENTHVAVYLLGHNAEEIEGNVQAAGCPAAPAAPQDDTTEQRASGPAAPAPRIELLGTRTTRRAVRLTLRSASPTSVRATLSRAGRVVARGTARIAGTGTLVLSARRALRPGDYVVRIAGAGTRRVTIR